MYWPIGLELWKVLRDRSLCADETKPLNIVHVIHMTLSFVQVQQRRNFALDGWSWEPSTHSPETGKGTPSQEPYVWPSVAAISRKVLGIRYSLLPYYYTLFYKANRPVDPLNEPSATVLKPLFFEFPKDSNTYSIDRQFLVGSALLISPVLELGESQVWQSCDNHVTVMWQ